MKARRARVMWTGVALAVVAVGGCSSSPAEVGPPTGTPGPVVPAGPGDWPMFGHDNHHTGVAVDFPRITDPKIAWHADLDGAVYGQPIVVGNTVFAGTENDTVYALDAKTGGVRWKKHLGSPVTRDELECGNIAPLGITGTLAYDPATKSVFAVTDTTGGEKTLYGFDPATGAITQKRNVDPPKGDRNDHQQRPALLVFDGRVYVAYGGHSGDCGDYHGTVVGAPTRGDAPNVSYVVPTLRRGGMWNPSGGVVDGDHVLFASGEGTSTTTYDGADSIISLSPDLKMLDRFAPEVWADDNARDLDLDTTAAAIVGDYVIAVGKRGIGYVLKKDHLGGIGGEVSKTTICRPAGADAIVGTTLYVPCLDGVQQITLSKDGKISLGWKATVPTSGTPVIGGGVMWITDWHAGLLYLLDPADGHVLSQLKVGDLPHFAAPSLAQGTAYLPTLTGVTAVR